MAITISFRSGSGSPKAIGDAATKQLRDARKKAKQDSWDAAEQGMNRAYGSVAITDEWREDALTCVRICATEKQHFMIDDVHEVMKRCGVKIETPTHGCALGAVMCIAKKTGYMERTPQTARSKRVSTHADVRPVWRSKLYKGDGNGESK